MTVRIFRSTDLGAPVLSGQVGSLIGVLDACLVNGLTWSVSSITRSGSTATVITTTPHGMIPGSDANRITISGAAQPEYNVTDVLVAVVSANMFTYQITGTPSSPATGTITAKKTSAGWSKPFSSTNIAAYRAGSGNRMYFRVDDTGTTTARGNGYENMVDSSAGIGPFPDPISQFSGGIYIQKSSAADSTARAWLLISNGTIFYLWVDVWSNQGTTLNTTLPAITVFGDFPSYKANDAYNTLIIGQAGGPVNATNAYQNMAFTDATVANSNSQGCHYLARLHTQIGGSVLFNKTTDYLRCNSGFLGTSPGGYAPAYPSVIDGGMYMSPVCINELSGHARGVLPGIWNPLHNKPLTIYSRFTGGGPLSGRSFETLPVGGSNGSGYGLGQIFIETSDTW